MPSKHWLLPALAALAMSGPVLADELHDDTRPRGFGSSAPRVECRWTKSKRNTALPRAAWRPSAQPPISRWEYPGFVVYFEHNLVIHAVAIG